MTRALKIRNQHGELVVNGDTYGTHCIGRATFVSLQQPHASGGGMVSGSSVYQFASTRSILWVIDLPIDRRVGILKTDYANGVHTLTAYCGYPAENGDFDQQERVTIWAFTTITEQVAVAGLLLRHSATNQVTHDFGAPALTFPLALGGLDIGVVVNSVARPVALGASPFYEATYVEGTGREYVKTDFRRMLVRRANGSVAYAPALVLRSGVMSGALPPDTVYSEPSPFFIIDGTNFP